jgi:peptidoglycan/xylan/chitin deacetylase (PgdA/CDA1 family)
MEKLALVTFFSYFCMVKRRFLTFVVCGVIITVAVLVYHCAPITIGKWSMQTAYIWLLDCWYGKAPNSAASILLVDDDGGNGIYQLKKICDETGFKATFAVIPARLSMREIDSLRKWQKEGFGICLHGYNHDDWKRWTSQNVIEDINKCESLLSKRGINMKELSRYVVTPYGRNTIAIRNAIQAKRYKMITGASLVNPDSTRFQLGRVFITKATEIKNVEELLKKAKAENAFIILGTHSSNIEEFAPEKIKATLTKAKEIGFEQL